MFSVLVVPSESSSVDSDLFSTAAPLDSRRNISAQLRAYALDLRLEYFQGSSQASSFVVRGSSITSPPVLGSSLFIGSPLRDLATLVFPARFCPTIRILTRLSKVLPYFKALRYAAKDLLPLSKMEDGIKSRRWKTYCIQWCIYQDRHPCSNTR